MKYETLTEEEKQFVKENYNKEYSSFDYNICIEEYCEKYVIRCECCDKLIITENEYDDSELHVCHGYLGEYKCCDECYEETDEYNYEHNGYYCEEDDYDKYVDYHCFGI